MFTLDTKEEIILTVAKNDALIDACAVKILAFHNDAVEFWGKTELLL